MIGRNRQSGGVEHWAGSAAKIVEDRARATDAFVVGIAAARAEAKRTMEQVDRREPDAQVAYLRERGGWSAIIREAFVAAVGDASVEGSFGSRCPVATVIYPSEIASIRVEATSHRL